LKSRRHHRKRRYEDHANHEAWAIPYGDLITLLLAFFVVMYAISSVNEGKYRVLSDSLVAAFRGTPKTMRPTSVTEDKQGSGMAGKAQLLRQGVLVGESKEVLAPGNATAAVAHHDAIDAPTLRALEQQRSLDRMAAVLRGSMGNLIDANLVSIHRTGSSVEVQIHSDILFPSGQAQLSSRAIPVLETLATTLKTFPNSLRVQGHTDNVPIRTTAFRSNWELSSARAASVVHLFADHGIEPQRLSVVGLAEFQQVADNRSEEGRNANRRVVIAILANDGAGADGSLQPSEAAAAAATP